MTVIKGGLQQVQFNTVGHRTPRAAKQTAVLIKNSQAIIGHLPSYLERLRPILMLYAAGACNQQGTVLIKAYSEKTIVMLIVWAYRDTPKLVFIIIIRVQQLGGEFCQETGSCWN